MLLTPANRVYVSRAALTPVVVGVVPAIKVDQHLLALHGSDGGHTGEGGVLAILGFQFHPNLKGGASNRLLLLLLLLGGGERGSHDLRSIKTLYLASH